MNNKEKLEKNLYLESLIKRFEACLSVIEAIVDQKCFEENFSEFKSIYSALKETKKQVQKFIEL